MAATLLNPEPCTLPNARIRTSPVGPHRQAEQRVAGDVSRRRRLRSAARRRSAMAPADVTTLVKDSGLRGRGGAGFPCGLKWTFLPKDHPGPIYLCVNADESEPGTFNNRILMEDDPHQLLEGIAIACYAIKSNTAYLYLRYEYGRSYRVLDAAIKECYAAGLARQEHSRQRASTSTSYLHRGAGGVHLRRRDGADRKPRRQAGLAADQAAVPRHRGPVPQADDRQQRRDALLRDAHPRSRRRTGSSRSASRPIRTILATWAATARSCTASAAT